MAVQKNRVAGVQLTHADRVVFPDQGATKLALAQYYEGVAPWILPHVRRRPLSLLRCPEGRSAQCFFQKHPGSSFPAGVPRVSIQEKSGAADYLYVDDVDHLIMLVQMGVLEIHVWGSLVDDLERPDILVFDLDPGDGVAWTTTVETARSLRRRLADLDLTSYLRTTGGKGLHLVVPLLPRCGWDEARIFARGVAEAQARDDERLTTSMSKSERGGRIFLDYLRNSRGSTAIANYSTRARPGAPVAVPIRWSELTPRLTSDRYTLDNVRRRLNALDDDPWEGFDEARRPLTPRIMAAVASSADA